MLTNRSQGIRPGFGAILYSKPRNLGSHKLKQGKVCPLCMDSISIPKCEPNLSLTTLEMGAITWGLERFKDYTGKTPLVKVYCNSASMVRALKKMFTEITDPV